MNSKNIDINHEIEAARVNMRFAHLHNLIASNYSASITYQKLNSTAGKLNEAAESEHAIRLYLIMRNVYDFIQHTDAMSKAFHKLVNGKAGVQCARRIAQGR